MILPAPIAIDASRFRAKVIAKALLAPMLLCLGLTSNSTESAIANGETRTITLSDSHTNESGSFTYMVNGAYDSSVLEKLNWFMRDWRHDEKISIDPRLFDIVWEVYRESGSSQPVDVLSGYRSPETNAMLRRRSRQVAEHSQHMLGKAMDAHFLDVPTARIRDIAMRLQAGGVGFYPTGNTPWVHIDSGSVRYWPRMSHDQIARLFPDGKTVFVPSDGVPLSGYQQAAAEIEARGGAVYAATAEPGASKGLLAMLFGGGEDEEEEGGGAHRGGGAMITASVGPPIASGGRGGQSPQSFFLAQAQTQGAASGTPDPVSKAKRDLPRGETFMKAPEPAPTVAVASAEPKPEIVASLEQPVANDASKTDIPEAPVAQWVAPLPPHRPLEFMTADAGRADAPMPPTRPVEFASLQLSGAITTATRSLAPIGDAQGKNDQIAALLARKLPSVITKGAGGAVPQGALALAEVGAPEPPERPATLARAAALSASLPPAGAAALSSPLARAAQLSAPLPGRHTPKAVLVAARIDRADFTVMTAAPAKGQNASSAGARIVPVAPNARSDELTAMLTPKAQAPGAFVSQPYGDLRSDAFTGPAVKPLDEAMAASEAAPSLRGSSD
jgi:uncharacterized protein YcbK (DUF882 family)